MRARGLMDEMEARWADRPEHPKVSWSGLPIRFASESRLQGQLFAFDELYRDGRIAWASTYIANNALFSAKNRRVHWGTFLASRDPAFRDDPDSLDDIGYRCGQLASMDPAPPGLRSLRALLDQESSGIFGLHLPLMFTGGRVITLQSLAIDPQLLPGGHLVGAPFPILLGRAEHGLAAVLPPPFWARDLVDFWTD